MNLRTLLACLDCFHVRSLLVLIYRRFFLDLGSSPIQYFLYFLLPYTSRFNHLLDAYPSKFLNLVFLISRHTQASQNQLEFW